MRNRTGSRKTATIMILLAGFLVDSAMAQQRAWVASPDGRIRIEMYTANKEGAHPRGHRLYYTVTYDKKPIVLDCPIGFDVQGVSGTFR